VASSVIMPKTGMAMEEGTIVRWMKKPGDPVRTGEPIAEIETTVRTSQACILSNIALRSGMTLDWDDNAKTVKQEAARKYLRAQYRAPWKLVV
jgi:pyruvate/2-oxoglutarate dehydrogenase complex dihydrolipoamide acyltransferase (E2) component